MNFYDVRYVRLYSDEYLWECYKRLFIRGCTYAAYSKIYNELKRREKLRSL